jgi:predicted CXXCH cytochrome family protein
MKRLLLVVPVLALLAVAAQADIINSAHNFSGSGWSGGEICKPCHTPHNALQGDPYAMANHVLWNHEITTATFTMFDGSTQQITTLSKLCLSCHDGTVALDSFGGNAGSVFIGAPGLVGTDLRNDHPVAVEYSENHHAPASDLQYARLWDNGSGKLFIECSTCHEPHNRNRQSHMLRVSNANSTLCFDCHRGK